MDNSDSPNKGRLFVTSAPHVAIYEPTGAYFTKLTQPVENSIDNVLSGLDVGPDGSIYVGSTNPGDRVSKYSPGLQELKKFYGVYFLGDEGEQRQEPCHLRADDTGALWLNHCDFYFQSTSTLSKYEADQFTDELDLPVFGVSIDAFAPLKAKPSPDVVPDPLLTYTSLQIPTNTFGQFDLDPDTNDLLRQQVQPDRDLQRRRS